MHCLGRPLCQLSLERQNRRPLPSPAKCHNVSDALKDWRELFLHTTRVFFGGSIRPTQLVFGRVGVMVYVISVWVGLGYG